MCRVPFTAHLEAVNCHHNYISREHHFGENVWVTRKGAVRAGAGEMGIIPGSMGLSHLLCAAWVMRRVFAAVATAQEE